jgi:uncharacterized delta-60 repeat protein
MRQLFMALLVVALAACNTPNDPQPAPDPTPISEPQPIPEPVPNPTPEPAPNPDPAPPATPEPEPTPVPEPVSPPSGSLDESFGEGGKFIFEIAGQTSQDKQGSLTAVTVQEDSKVISAGQTASNRFLIARHNVDGSLDTTFHGDGFFATTAASKATDLAIGQESVIHAVGLAPKTAGSEACGLHVILQGENQVDTSPQLCPDSDTISEAALTKDSRERFISVYLQRAGEEFILTRHRADGTLDTTGFGDEGVARDNNSFFDVSVNLLGVFVRANGDIIVVAHNLIRKSIGVVTYNTKGEFVRQGLLELPQAFREVVLENATLDGRGRIIAAGSLGGNQAALLRFALFASPELDTTFDDDGIVIRNESSETFSNFSDTVLDDQGRIIAVGTRTGVPISPTRFLVERYLGDGTLDTSFGTGGHAEIDVSSVFTQVSSVSLDKSGKIIVAGSANLFPALVRLNP